VSTIPLRRAHNKESVVHDTTGEPAGIDLRHGVAALRRLREEQGVPPSPNNPQPQATPLNGSGSGAASRDPTGRRNICDDLVAGREMPKGQAPVGRGCQKERAEGASADSHSGLGRLRVGVVRD
jgi:hypothetical protein